jgi:hypothetical protein
MPMKNRIPIHIAVLAGLLTFAVWCNGENMSVATEVQATMFKKIFSYDRALNSSGDIAVILVGSKEEKDTATELVKAFDDVGIFAAFINTGVIDGDLRPNTVVYIMAGADNDQVKQFCTDNGVLSISGLTTLAKEGHASVSIGEGSQRPQIIVNMNRLLEEGHELSADLLKLARVIR